MESMVEGVQQMFQGGDGQRAVHREMRVNGPGLSIEVDFAMPAGKSEGKSHHQHHHRTNFFQRFKKRASRMKRKMMRKMRMPKWMRKGPFGFQKRQMKKMWFRKALLERCPEAKTLCPATKCPKRLLKCLRLHVSREAKAVSVQCAGFVQKMGDFKAKKKALKREFRATRRECRHRSYQERRQCIHNARSKKKMGILALRTELKESLDASSTMTVQKEEPETMLQKTETKAEKFFTDKMKKLKDFMGVGESNLNAKKASTCSKLDKRTVCDQNSKCAWCQSRDKSSCYDLKTSKHMPSTFTCDKREEQKPTSTDAPKADADKKTMSESTPGWITGSIEEPRGKKKMDGWTMRVYTLEQQKRLGVDETGETPLKLTQKPDDTHPATVSEGQVSGPALWAFVAMLTALGVAVIGLGVYAKRRAAQVKAVELSAVYDQMKAAAPPLGSEDQV